MLLLFQHGIPDVFFSDLERRGARIIRFAASASESHTIFAENKNADAIFFRANYTLGKAELDLLPNLRLAALVSTGADNVAIAEIEKRGIQFSSGEGANARAVFDYVIQALCFDNFDFTRDSLGIVGVGNIGSRLLKFFRAIDASVAFYDPLLADPGSLDSVLQCDVVTFHVPLVHGSTEAVANTMFSLPQPLTHGGVGSAAGRKPSLPTTLSSGSPHPTAAMLDVDYFSSIRKKLRVIQSCRGGIWNLDFYRRLGDHPHLELIAQDVYPVEPPDKTDCARAKISTPHIAGYSTRGRLGGILRGIDRLFPNFSRETTWPESRAWFLDIEAARFAAAPEKFNALRDGYFYRKEFHEYNTTERGEFRQRFPRLSEHFCEALWAFGKLAH